MSPCASNPSLGMSAATWSELRSIMTMCELPFTPTAGEIDPIGRPTLPPQCVARNIFRRDAEFRSIGRIRQSNAPQTWMRDGFFRRAPSSTLIPDPRARRLDRNNSFHFV